MPDAILQFLSVLIGHFKSLIRIAESGLTPVFTQNLSRILF